MNRKVLIIAGVASIGLAAVAAYQAAAAIVRPDREGVVSVNRMKDLPSIEHARLEKDFQSFYSKTPEEQQRLRAMHDALQGRGKPAQLRQISLNFYAWFSNLRPRQRFDIRDETNVEKKLQLVRTIQKEMEEQQQADNENSFSRRRGSPRKKLSPQELAALMGVIEDKLRRDDAAAAEQLDAIEDLAGYNRYYSVMSIAIKSFGDVRGPDSLQRMRRFFSDEEFAEALPERGPRKAGPTKNGRPPQSQYLLWTLLESLRGAYIEEIKKDEPTEKDLVDHFVKLPLDDQERLMLQSTNDFMRWLKRDFIHKHPERYPRDPSELFGDRRSRGPREGGRRRRNLNGFPGPAPRDGRPPRKQQPGRE